MVLVSGSPCLCIFFELGLLLIFGAHHGRANHLIPRKNEKPAHSDHYCWLALVMRLFPSFQIALEKENKAERAHIGEMFGGGVVFWVDHTGALDLSMADLSLYGAM